MACPKLDGCPLFPRLTRSLEVWRRLYCQSPPNYPSCARFCRSAEGRPVPADLMPNGRRLG